MESGHLLWEVQIVIINFMLIGATLLLVACGFLVSVRIVYLLRRSQNKGKGLGKKKGIRFLTIFYPRAGMVLCCSIESC